MKKKILLSISFLFLLSLIVFYFVFHSKNFQNFIKNKILQIIPINYHSVQFIFFPPAIVFQLVDFKKDNLEIFCKKLFITSPLLTSIPFKINPKCENGSINILGESKEKKFSLDKLPEKINIQILFLQVKDFFKNFFFIEKFSLKNIIIKNKTRQVLVKRSQLTLNNDSIHFSSDITSEEFKSSANIQFLLTKKSIQINNFHLIHPELTIKTFGNLEKNKDFLPLEIKSSLKILPDFSGSFIFKGFISLKEIFGNFSINNFYSPYFYEDKMQGKISLTKNSIFIRELFGFYDDIQSFSIKNTYIYKKVLFPDPIKIKSNNLSLEKVLHFLPDVRKKVFGFISGDYIFTYTDQDNFRVESNLIHGIDLSLILETSIFKIQKVELKKAEFFMKKKNFFINLEQENFITAQGSVNPLNYSILLKDVSLEKISLIPSIKTKGLFNGSIDLKDNIINVKGNVDSLNIFDLNLGNSFVNLFIDIEKSILKLQECTLKNTFKNSVNGSLDLSKEQVDLLITTEKISTKNVKNIYPFDFLKFIQGNFSGKINISNTFENPNYSVEGFLEKASIVNNYFEKINFATTYNEKSLTMHNFSINKKNEYLTGNFYYIFSTNKLETFSIKSSPLKSSFFSYFSSFIPFNHEILLDIKKNKTTNGLLSINSINQEKNIKNTCSFKEDLVNCQLINKDCLLSGSIENLQPNLSGTLNTKNYEIINKFMPNHSQLKSFFLNLDFSLRYNGKLYLESNIKNLDTNIYNQYLTLNKPFKLTINDHNYLWNFELKNNESNIVSSAKNKIFTNTFNIKNMNFSYKDYFSIDGSFLAELNYSNKLYFSFKSDLLTLKLSEVNESIKFQTNIKYDKKIFINYVKTDNKSIMCNANNCNFNNFFLEKNSSSFLMNGSLQYLNQSNILKGSLVVDNLKIKDKIEDLIPQSYSRSIKEFFLPVTKNEKSKMNIDTSIRVNNAVIENSLLNISLEGNINLKESIENPRVNTALKLKDSSFISINENKLDITSLKITSHDYFHTIKPSIHLSSNGLIENYLITINLNGNIEKYTTTLSSSPKLSEEQILSLLFFKHTETTNKNITKSQNFQSQFLSIGITIFDQLQISKDLRKNQNIQIKLISENEENNYNIIEPDLYLKKKSNTKLEITKQLANDSTISYKRRLGDESIEENKVTYQKKINKNAKLELFYEKKNSSNTINPGKYNYIGGGLNFNWSFK